MGTLMDAMLGPDGRPSRFDGAAWVSADGRYWWNGAAWQPVRKSGGFRLPIALPAIILVLAVAAWFVVTRVLPPPGKTAVQLGVTNPKIDDRGRVELDYARADICADLTFELIFYDKAGHPVADYVSDSYHNVTGSTEHHYVLYTYQAIPATAVRFDAVATCH